MNKQSLLDQARSFYTEDQLFEIDHAIDFATEMHEGQKRKSGEPYITHPLSVASILIEWGMDSDTIIAGVLHDTVEDTDATLDKIESLFGYDVSFLVDGVTKISQARAGMRDLEQYLPQTKDNLTKLLIAVGQDVRVVIIKLADRLHNMRTLQYKSSAKQQKIARETLEVFAPMADQLGMGRVRMELEEKSFSYLDPKESKRLEKLMRQRLGKSTRKLGAVRLEVERALQAEGLDFEVNGRVKSLYSLHKKLQKRGHIDNIYDLMALRVIVQDKEQCYRVLGILHGMYQPMVARIKDYISVPKPNGYQSLHTTVITPNKQIVEFQIRTRGMHEYAERGLAASFHYQQQKNSKEYQKGDSRRGVSQLPAQLQWISQLQEIAARLRAGEDIPRQQLSIDLFRNRIFVYSPKGDIYNLPEGALPLDFAYAVHSDVAKHAYGFRINGKMESFERPLENGDVIEVLTRKLSYPKPGWAQLVTTSHARDKLRLQLNKVRVQAVNEAISLTDKIIPMRPFTKRSKK